MATREELENEKLRLEVESLKKSFAASPTFWFGLVSVLVAVVGVIAQSYLSRIESEKAELLTEQSKKELAEIKLKRDSTQKQIDSNRIQIAALLAERDNLSKQTTRLIGAVKQSGADSSKGNTSRQSTQIRDAVNTAANSLYSITLYGYKVEPDQLKTVSNYLSSNGYSLIESKLLTERPAWLSQTAEVLYYDDRTLAKAQMLAEALTKQTGTQFRYSKGAGLGVGKGTEQFTLKIHFVL